MIRNKNGYINDSAFPLYYFGHGLSYTQFKYSDLKLSSEYIDANETLVISLSVQNIGEVDGDEVVQIYYSDKVASIVRPTIEYAGAVRVHIRAGKTIHIEFQLKASQLAFIDRQMDWIVEKGEYSVMVGASVNDLRLKGIFNVSETKSIDSTKRGFYAEASTRTD